MNENLLDQMKDIIYKETLYLRHYIGEVVDNQDELQKGRVKITLPELGLASPDSAIWCHPSGQAASLNVPVVGSWAEVYFINGDETKPVYLFPASQILDNTPKSYDGKVTTHILHEGPEGITIKYDETKKLLTILAGNEAFVKGTTIMPEHIKVMDLLVAITNIISGTPINEPGNGAPSALQVALKAAITGLNNPSYSNDQLSEKIKGE